MGSGDGTRAVVAEAVGQAAAALGADRAAEAAAQLSLLPALPSRFSGEERQAQEQRAATGRPGRPPGAQNKASRELREYWRSIGFSPTAWRVAWAQHSPESLAKELGCTTAEAFDRLDRIYAELQQYEVGKAAPTDGDGNAVPFIQMMVGGAHAPGGVAIAGGVTPWQADPRRALPREEITGKASEINGLTNDPAREEITVSHSDQSHEAGK